MTTVKDVATKVAKALQEMGWDLGYESHKVCVACQTQLMEDSHWCHNCGTKVLTPSEDAITDIEKALIQSAE